ncbi:peptidase MA family metallohydrolase [Sphaerimonospora cavernae]|uniref:Peptidase MA family metallohydrolase n=1 Tax=Sphaerimonospora cavernae TaxID=1740611 RepID=A0ABV6TXZ3_9ACTN
MLRIRALAWLSALVRSAALVRPAVLIGLLVLPAAAAPDDRLLPRARAIAGEHPGVWAGASLARGEHVVVVGGRRGLIGELADQADRGSRTVARVWGRPVDAVVLVPATTEQAAVLAAPARVAGLAALAGPGRVIIEPSGFARLSAAGRRIVITHELTHVATDAAETGDMPAWLVEGFADYVGYSGSGLTAREIAAELAADLRAGAPPRALPDHADFAAGSPRRAQAYEEAWLACRYIAERFGENRLVALYRAAMGTGSNGPAGIEAALRATLGVSTVELTRSWLAYLPTVISR